MKNLEYYMNLDYEIVIKKVSLEDGDGWFAYYKDFKGVMGDGESAIEAIESAQSAFSAFVEVSLTQGDSIPEPHTNEKSLRINISMPENLVKKIDSYIEPLHLSRSAFLQKAAMREIGI
ncbi:MAG: type II toxin-antitoxin system HicB family antitoxin [Sulfuricurvum sp.]|uniref:type II toxin-antitoxin system HicB family antitoxin n=1 Tax=Sulfuricurvum sp. TaxID=2025608 RepID=UPI0026255135|nr:type II toxin-antitoxin system HicB family antitoxin [Sulfuricurvum sp.]MDD2828512.1 type II toxin-antitoxin system HicB family antitoxin [Sulfuricurvum sp.]MDD4948957.1 type II toxin-antitoxin system HicB family antitoxin [Sulfuricurvum sp.]